MFKPLRDKILELAITGKLVPQLDSEPAVEQIGATPAIEDAPFAIPEKWKWVQIGNLLPFGKNATQVDPSKIPSNAWVLGLEDIESNGGLISKNRNALVSSSKNAFNAGNVLYSKMRPYLNKAIIADEDGYCTTEIFVLDVLKAVLPLDAEYLLYFLRSPYFVSYAIKSSKGQKPRLDTKLGQKALFPLPPIEEQRRIVAKLDDIMGNLERMDQAYTDLSGPMLKHFKNLVLQQAISGQLVPQLDSEPSVEQIGPAPAKEDEPFALPKKWKWVRLKSLADHIQYGYTASASDSGEVKLLRITDLHEGKVNWDSVPFCSISSADIAKFKLLPNDIVIARSGATVGKSFKVGQIEHEAVFASYLIRIGLNDKLPVSASYIKTYLDSPIYWYSIFQSARGTAMKNVNAQQLGALLIPLPPLEEQRRIVARIEELFGDVDKLLDWQQFA